jgi:hypothetical protein
MNWMTSAKNRVQRCKKKRSNDLRLAASSKLLGGVLNRGSQQHAPAPVSRPAQAKSAVVKPRQSTDSEHHSIALLPSSTHHFILLQIILFFPPLRIQSTCSTTSPESGQSVLQVHRQQRPNRENLPMLLWTPHILRRGARNSIR